VSAPELLVIRHGQSEWNRQGLWQGHADPPLSAEGLRQAESLVQTLATESIDRLEASDLRRARQTAAPLAAARGFAVRTDPLYRELDLGEWSGLTGTQIEERGESILDVFQAGSPTAAAPGGESRQQLWARAREALVALCERCPGERVAVVTHGGFVYACFPDVDAANASVHRGPADELLERLERGLGGVRSDAY